MKLNIDILERSEKIRIMVFTVITLIAAVFAVAYVWECCGLFKEPPINTDGMDVYVDGGNFNWFFVPVASGLNGFLMLITIVIYVVFMFVVDFLAYGLFRIFVFRKTDVVNGTEYKLAKKIFSSILLASIGISLFISRFHYLICIALFLFPIWLFGYLFYILPLKLMSLELKQ